MKRKCLPIQKAALAAGLLLILLLAAVNYSSLNAHRHVLSRARTAACNVSRGEWVPDTGAPYYTNATCPFIDDRQDCMKYGKPGLESSLRWRWRPDECELPRFDPARFLSLVRHKSMAFVGDSVARNHLQSLMCLLSQVEYPREIEPKDCIHCTRKYYYREHDFTVCVFWTPFLVRWNLTHPDGQQFMGLHNVFLDETDPEWTGAIAGYDYVIVNGAKWFTRPIMLYERGRLVGCSDCVMANVTAVRPHHAVSMSFRTALRALREHAGFRAKVVVRTVAPPHYENGKWYDGGNCLRTRPTRRNVTRLQETEAEFHAAQVEEFREAASAAAAGRFALMDVSEMMQMRGDGHPGQYGHWPHEKVGFGIDCVHWCLPGPIDAWNVLLLHLMSS